jgi:hypothetical protein
MLIWASQRQLTGLKVRSDSSARPACNEQQHPMIRFAVRRDNHYATFVIK